MANCVENPPELIPLLSEAEKNLNNTSRFNDAVVYLSSPLYSFNILFIVSILDERVHYAAFI